MNESTDRIPDPPEWFPDFTERHINRCPSNGKWPRRVGSQFGQDWLDCFEPWILQFVRRGVTRDVADSASAMMATKNVPPPGAKHLEVFMAFVTQVWNLGAAGAEVPLTREDAERRSRDCPECAGCGLTTRKLSVEHMPRSMVVKNRKVSWFCLCPAGEYLASAHRGEKSALRGLRRLAQYPELWDKRYGVHPCWPVLPVPRNWPIESCWDRTEFDGPENDPANMMIYVHSRDRLKDIGCAASSEHTPY